MKTGHFFDLDTLLVMDNKAWVVSKSNPNEPIMKINKSDFNLIKSGIYKSQNNRVDFNGNIFWLPENMMNKMKVLVKNRQINISELAISLREFIDEDIINSKEFKLNYNTIQDLKNTTDDIYIICSKETAKSYKNVLERIVERLKEEGIVIKSYYHVTETFYNQNSDDIKYNKLKIFVQHLTGYKMENGIFQNEEIVKYNKIKYYGNDLCTEQYPSYVNKVLREAYNKSENSMKTVIKEDVNYDKPMFTSIRVTDNKYNRTITNDIPITLSSYIKTFDIYKNED